MTTTTEVRTSKRQRIYELFKNNLQNPDKVPTPFKSSDLHLEFGSSFRARVSEINLDPNCDITIKNEYWLDQKQAKEISVYWSVPRLPDPAASDTIPA